MLLARKCHCEEPLANVRDRFHLITVVGLFLFARNWREIGEFSKLSNGRLFYMLSKYFECFFMFFFTGDSGLFQDKLIKKLYFKTLWVLDFEKGFTYYWWRWWWWYGLIKWEFLWMVSSRCLVSFSNFFGRPSRMLLKLAVHKAFGAAVCKAPIFFTIMFTMAVSSG